jgi:hypothetical protein
MMTTLHTLPNCILLHDRAVIMPEAIDCDILYASVHYMQENIFKFYMLYHVRFSKFADQYINVDQKLCDFVFTYFT